MAAMSAMAAATVIDGKQAAASVIEAMVLMAMGYFQPVTRGELSKELLTKREQNQDRKPGTRYVDLDGGRQTPADSQRHSNSDCHQR
ncbi:hypothetical protein [Rhizobium lusitanum]|uniref:hypothetical protein n=1 Tax=Rhizobium lusitanum TaxID=293958 RepID=UPI00336A7652